MSDIISIMILTIVILYMVAMIICLIKVVK